jgi:hypothetical protein
MKIWTFANDWKIIISYYYPIASILQIVTDAPFDGLNHESKRWKQWKDKELWHVP